MAAAIPADSVPLDLPAGGPEYSEAAHEKPRLQVSNIKLLISLFVIFMFVVSDVFTGNVVAGFGESAVHGSSPTTWGVVLQGIFLVIFYILAVYLTEHGFI